MPVWIKGCYIRLYVGATYYEPIDTLILNVQSRANGMRMPGGETAERDWIKFGEFLEEHRYEQK